MERASLWKPILKYGLSLVLILLALGAGVARGFFLPTGEEGKKPKDPTPLPPVTAAESESGEEKKEENLWDSLSDVPLMKGIDVSKWQGKPDWKKIAADGVNFAMLRVGFHGTSGAYGEDESFAYNAAKADENGILVGAYFYSLAKNEAEAASEAAWVLQKLSPYAISMPVVIDYEMAENEGSLSAALRTDIALAFLRTVREGGYESMLYVPMEEFENPALWDKERVLPEFFVWGAGVGDPAVNRPQSKVPYAMWQYSNTGKVAGIAGNVDQNLAYFSRARLAPKEEEPVDPAVDNSAPVREFNQTFTPAQRRVTAKIEVNLRSIPSIDGEIVGTLKNGEYLMCTGDSDMGWSSLMRNGKRVFAVTTYLMDENGVGTVSQQSFRAVSDQVTAKDSVNLRAQPGVDSEVVGVLENGTVLKRTGIGDKGWSRLEYQGQIVYAVTSYLTEA